MKKPQDSKTPINGVQIILDLFLSVPTSDK